MIFFNLIAVAITLDGTKNFTPLTIVRRLLFIGDAEVLKGI